jgi:hypothetical protein|nr:MAG TPA: hypothetical protein [Caudoviricetes sp.]
MKATIHYTIDKSQYEALRDVQIIPAPQGCFAMDDPGYISFPYAIALAPAISDKELSYGKILSCPITGDCEGCGGFESLYVSEIYTCVTSWILYESVKVNMFEYTDDDFNSALSMALDNFRVHNVAMDRSCEDYLKMIQKEGRLISMEEFRRMRNEKGTD